MCINRRAAHWYNEAQHEFLAPAYAMAMRISGEGFCFRHRRMNRPPEARRNRFQCAGKVLIESKLVACDPFNLLRGDGAVNGTMIRMEIECGKNTAAVAHILKHKGFPAADGIHSQAIPGGHGWPVASQDSSIPEDQGLKGLRLAASQGIAHGGVQYFL